MENTDEKDFLNFDEINKEIRTHNRKFNKIKLKSEYRKSFKKEKIKQLNECLDYILSSLSPKKYIFNAWYPNHPRYILLGHFFEGLLKIILFNDDYDKFFSNLDKKDSSKNFEDMKNEVIKLLESKKTPKIPKKQIERIRNVIEFVQIQRNNFVHFPIGSCGHYAPKHQVYSVILKLIKEFSLKISPETITKLKKEKESKVSGRDFKDVGL